MTTLNMGKIGVKRASYSNGSLRERFAEFVADRPTTAPAELAAEYTELLIAEDDTDALRFMALWFLTNEANRLAQTRRSVPAETTKRKALTEARRKTFEQEVRRHTIASAPRIAANGIVILDTVLSNGKTLRDCTVAEAREFGEKVAGLVKLLDGYAPNARVGDIITPTQAAVLARAA